MDDKNIDDNLSILNHKNHINSEMFESALLENNEISNNDHQKSLTQHVKVSKIARVSKQGSPKESPRRFSFHSVPHFDYTKPIYLCKICSILLVYEGNIKPIYWA